MNPESDYEGWLKHRRDLPESADLTNRIMSAVEATSDQPVEPRPTTPPRSRIGPVLLWTAASLVFVARIAALVGNLVFPTNSYPEYAADQHSEEVPHEHQNVSRS